MPRRICNRDFLRMAENLLALVLASDASKDLLYSMLGMLKDFARKHGLREADIDIALSLAFKNINKRAFEAVLEGLEYDEEGGGL